jgi:hypothetical protein
MVRWCSYNFVEKNNGHRSCPVGKIDGPATLCYRIRTDRRIEGGVSGSSEGSESGVFLAEIKEATSSANTSRAIVIRKPASLVWNVCVIHRRHPTATSAENRDRQRPQLHHPPPVLPASDCNRRAGNDQETEAIEFAHRSGNDQTAKEPRGQDGVNGSVDFRFHIGSIAGLQTPKEYPRVEKGRVRRLGGPHFVFWAKQIT